MKRFKSRVLSESFLENPTPEEMAKDKEELDKEVEKELDKLVDVVEDDINEQPDTEVKYTDGEGKALVIKQLTEKLTLDEDIPGDLIKAYKSDNYSKPGQASYNNYFNMNKNLDYFNSNYEELTKDQALAMMKTNPDSIRLIISDRRGKPALVTKGPKNEGDAENNRIWLPDDKAYRNRNGKVITDTAHVPFSYLISIADKIYSANEVAKDQNLLDTRKANNPNFALQGNYGLFIDFDGDIKRIRNRLARAYTDSAKAQYRQAIKDIMARRDYAFSEAALRAPLKAYHELKNRNEDLSDRIENVNNSIKNFEPSSKNIKYRIDRIKQQLSDLYGDLIDYSIRLDIADEADADQLNELNSKLNDYENKMTDIQVKLGELLNDPYNKNKTDDSSTQQVTESFKVISSLESFRPWSGAEDTWRKIEEAGLLDELESILEELYPDGMSETELNDFLWFEQDYILELLGLSEEGQDEE